MEWLVDQGVNVNPQTDPESEPEKIEVPGPTRCDTYCDPWAFMNWWWTLDEQINQDTDADWYHYENQVARWNGSYGNHPRNVGFIHADGIEPLVCGLVEAKYIENPESSIYNLYHIGTRPDTLQPILMGDFYTEIVNYRRAIDYSNAPIGARPQKLIIRTNTLDLRIWTSFMVTLNAAGFTLGYDAYIQHYPYYDTNISP